MLLFENKKRSFEGPSPHNHNEYQYYDESARPEIKLIRQQLNNWFACYPKDHQRELKARFEKEFQDPFYELLIHELLRRHEFELQPHPTLSWTKRHPDFLVSNEATQFYVEAKVVRCKSHEESSRENLTSTLYDEINKMPIRDFFLEIGKVVFKSGMQPSGKKVRNFLSENLPRFDPDELTTRILRFGIPHKSDLEFEDDNLRLEIRLMPKSREARGKPGRAIGIYPAVSLWGSIVERLREAVKEKGSRYGDFDRPYLICVNVVGDEPPDDDDVFNAVFGTLGHRFKRNVENPNPIPYRAYDGAFFSQRAGANISAVLVTRTGISNAATVKHWLIKNPNARHEFPLESFRLHSFFVNEDRIENCEGSTIGEVLELSS